MKRREFRLKPGGPTTLRRLELSQLSRLVVHYSDHNIDMYLP